MAVIERGAGTPIVLVPGLQGRWEYLQPAIDALAESFRVLTFPLCDEPASRRPFDPARGLDSFVDQIAGVLDERNLTRAVICGVSFGGLIAVRFAALRPERTAALVLVSAPGPGWHLRPRHETYARWPRLLAPLFFVETPRRLRAEIVTALPDWRERWRFGRQQLAALLRAPLSPSRMAARARLIAGAAGADDCGRVTAPTLVISGEPGLDHVVPADGTSQYARLIPNARAVVLSRTGHLGSITRPREFAAAVREFMGSVSLKQDDHAA